MAAVAAVYFAAAWLGLRLGVVEQVSAVWPPTGIALAVLLLGGYRLWPAILLGAFLANVQANEPLLTAGGIAAGNTLEALAGAWLLRRVVGFRPALARPRDALGLVLLAAGLSTTLSATVGVTSLCLGGVHPWSRYGPLWCVWWLGDALGALVVAPLLLTWAAGPRLVRRPWAVTEFAALLGGLIAVSLSAFAGGVGVGLAHHPLEYTVFPFVIWAALRFGPPTTTLVTFLASGIAILGAVYGLGPFTGGTLNERLILLQMFTGVVACTGLLLAAATAERDTVARHRAAAYAATQLLAQSATLGEVAPGLLEAVGRGLGWDLGALWEADPGGDVLRCVAVWHDPSAPAAGFADETRHQTLSPGVGLPGRVWAGGQPLGVADATADAGCPRAPAAARDGLHAALAVPILVQGSPLGVLEFFSRGRRTPDPELLQLALALGGQVGLFLERRRADESLRHGHEVLRAVTEGTTDAVFVKDQQGRYLMINPAGARFLGRTVEEVLGRDDAELFTPETGRAIMAADRQVMASGEARTYEEMATAAGVTRTYLSMKGPYRDARGNVIGLIGISRDITERKRAEEERARLLTYEQAARAEAERLYQEAREGERHRDEFLAMLAHELRNPLAPLRDALHVFRRLAPADPELAWAGGVLDRQVQQLGRLVDDLLDVSRITRGMIELRKEVIDLAEVVGRAVETSRPLVDARRQQLTVALPDAPVYLEADPTRLAQVLANLLNNAAKYTPEGGRIWLAAERADGGEVVLRVRDTGVGIPAEMLPKVFDPFTQADRSLDRSQGGLGIGLTLVRSLVELHGGRVEAASEGLGRGSEFIVRLPALAGEPRPAAAPGREEGPPDAAAGRRVLVVDDNADAAECLAWVLRARGHEVCTAHDGVAALEAARGSRPEVVLLDIGLPRMDGYEVARRLRREPGLEKVLLVALTGYGHEDDRRRSRAAGFDHHLVKPADPAELTRLLAAGAAGTEWGAGG
jgi:two-component system CheB/CheR fusion protein